MAGRADPDKNGSVPEVSILLGLYQGAPYLREQLDSYVTQTHANWSLIVSDDGPEDRDDGGRAILADFCAAHPDRAITRCPGPRAGFVRNFLSLLQAAPAHVPYAALSDQDDVWYPHRLARAVAMLAQVPAGQPALYCARTMIGSEQLEEIAPSPVFPHAPDFRNALVQSIGGGNTMVLNRAALDLVGAAAGEASDPVAHDWWLYQVITGCGGQVLRDPEPALIYRQHGGNLIGANLSSAARFTRVLALLSGRFRDWNDTGLAALAGSAHRFTPEARMVLDQYVAARRGSVLSRLRRLRRSGVWRQGRSGTVALYLACVLNRL